jgi:Glycine zipper 2TM domain
MIKTRLLMSSVAAAALLTTSACVTDPNTGEKKISRTAMGGVGGAVVGGLLGGLIGGKTGRIVGAGIGGVAGGVVGYKMDQQIKTLKENTAGSGVEVTETDGGKAILVNLPDGVTFDVGSYTLKPEFRTTLDQVAQSLIDRLGHLQPDPLGKPRAHGDELPGLARGPLGAAQEPGLRRNHAGGRQRHGRRPDQEPPGRDQDRPDHPGRRGGGEERQLIVREIDEERLA